MYLLCFPGIDYLIPLLGSLSTGFIVIFPGLCLLEMALTRLEKGRAESDDSDESDENDKSGNSSTTNILSDNGGIDDVFQQPPLNWRGLGLLATALFLLVFSAFILGIIVINSFNNLNLKTPLCQK